MGTPASPDRQNGVQAYSSSPPHCCRSCGTRAEVPLLRMRPLDAWTCRDGENGGNSIHDYIRDNYCPTLDSTAAQHFCEDSLSKYYVGMLFAVVEHWFVDGALQVCQTAGTCDARE